MLLALHILGGIALITFCGYKIFFGKGRSTSWVGVWHLMIGTLLQSATGAVLAVTNSIESSDIYCARGIAYFSLVGMTWIYMLRKGASGQFAPAQLMMFSFSVMTFLTPLLLR